MTTQHAFIYMLTGDCGKVYIGSSTMTPGARFNHHKSAFNTTTSIELINPKIEVLENLNNCTREEVRRREQEYLAQYSDVVVNRYRAHLTESERKNASKKYYRENEEYRKKRIEQATNRQRSQQIKKWTEQLQKGQKRPSEHILQKNGLKIENNQIVPI